MATYHINADTGNDTTGDGSELLPWLTISKANTSSIDDDTINIQDSLAEYSWTALTMSNRVITGEVAGSRTTNGIGSVVSTTAAITWNINGTLTWSDTIFKGSIAARVFYYVSNTVVLTATRCDFKDMTGLATATDGGVFGSNSLGNQTYTFNSCNFINIRATTPTNVAILRFRSASGGTSTINIINCNFVFPDDMDSSDTPAYLWRGVSGSGATVIAKNIIAANFGSGTLTHQTGLVAVDYSHSNFYQISGSPTGTNLIDADPLFVDVANENFNLRSNGDDVLSPCIDTGIII